MASAPRITCDGVWTGASWTTGVSNIVDADAEADRSGNIKGVKDWITASDTAFAIPWTMVELVSMDGTVRMGGDDVVAVVVADDDVVAVVVGLDAEVETTVAERTRLTGGIRGAELRAVLLGREGRGIVLVKRQEGDDYLLLPVMSSPSKTTRNR